MTNLNEQPDINSSKSEVARVGEYCQNEEKVEDIKSPNTLVPQLNAYSIRFGKYCQSHKRIAQKVTAAVRKSVYYGYLKKLAHEN